MKKVIELFFIVWCIFIVPIRTNAQYIGFEPNNNEIITNAYFDLHYTVETTPYPPKYSAASFVKLTTHNNVYYANVSNTNYGNFPQQFWLSSGTYEWTMELYEHFLGESSFVLTASCTNTFYMKYEIHAENNFGGGIINLENSQIQSTSSVKKFVGEQVDVGAIDQQFSNYYYVWNTNGTNNSIWKIHGQNIFGATSRELSYTITSNDRDATLIADMKKICNLTFENSGSGVYINGNLYSAPKEIEIVEETPIYASGENYTSNGLEYRFSNWISEGQSLQMPIVTNEHKTYEAVYTRYPSNNGKNPSFNSSTGDPINITWTDNPNDDVTQYQIWRKVKHNGVLGSATLLATIDKGVETYTDYEYIFTNGYTDDMLYYDVREYYEPDNTYSDPEWNMVYGEYNNENKVKNDKAFAKLKEAIPENYSISNFPNPFNPTTTINYQLPQDGFVTLKVYDILGKEIASLVNENKTAGYYKVNFDAGRLTSGIYIYTISVNNFIQSKKMLLVK